MDRLIAKTIIPWNSMVKYLSENVYIVVKLPFVMKECRILQIWWQGNHFLYFVVVNILFPLLDP